MSCWCWELLKVIFYQSSTENNLKTVVSMCADSRKPISSDLSITSMTHTIITRITSCHISPAMTHNQPIRRDNFLQWPGTTGQSSWFMDVLSIMHHLCALCLSPRHYFRITTITVSLHDTKDFPLFILECKRNVNKTFYNKVVFCFY